MNSEEKSIQELCIEYIKKYKEYDKQKEILKVQKENIKEVKKEELLGDLKNGKENLEREKEKIKSKLKKEKIICVFSVLIIIVLSILFYKIGFLNRIAQTKFFWIGIITKTVAEVILIVVVIIFILNFLNKKFNCIKILFKKGMIKFGIMLFIILSFIGCYIKLSKYDSLGTIIPVSNSSLEGKAEFGFCILFAIIISIIVFIVTTYINTKGKGIKFLKERKRELEKKIEKLEEEKKSSELIAKEEELKEKIKNIFEKLNKSKRTAQEVNGMLAEKFYLTDWEWESENKSLPFMMQIDKAREPLVFLYYWKDYSKESEVLNKLILTMCLTVANFNCGKLFDLSLIDFLADTRAIYKKLEKGCKIIKKDSREDWMKDILDRKDKIEESIDSYNKSQIKEINPAFKQHQIVQFVIPPKNIPQFDDFWKSDYWKLITDSEKYGLHPIFYVEQTDWESSSEFIDNLKEYMKNYSVYIMEENYCCKEYKKGEC